MSVAAVVVTHDRRALLARCLAALDAQTRPCERIYVVDNASTDGTGELLAAWAAGGRVARSCASSATPAAPVASTRGSSEPTPTATPGSG